MTPTSNKGVIHIVSYDLTPSQTWDMTFCPAMMPTCNKGVSHTVTYDLTPSQTWVMTFCPAMTPTSNKGVSHTVLYDLTPSQLCEGSYQGGTQLMTSWLKGSVTAYVTCHFVREEDWGKMQLNKPVRKNLERRPHSWQWGKCASYIITFSRLNREKLWQLWGSVISASVVLHRGNHQKDHRPRKQTS